MRQRVHSSLLRAGGLPRARAAGALRGPCQAAQGPRRPRQHRCYIIILL